MVRGILTYVGSILFFLMLVASISDNVELAFGLLVGAGLCFAGVFIFSIPDAVSYLRNRKKGD